MQLKEPGKNMSRTNSQKALSLVIRTMLTKSKTQLLSESTQSRSNELAIH